NSPKFISCLNPELELQFHYKVHTSLDVVEEKLSSSGINTGDMFRRLHNLYTDVVCNPFYIPGDPITSKNFDDTVKSIMLLCCSVVLAACAFSTAYPYAAQSTFPVYDQQVDESAFAPSVVAAPTQDLEGAATGHHGHHGRVQIKVYRGPTTHGHHDHFAPHGFWVKQPADDHH
ncbi:Uncharacterized protein GBIM_07918, partial [Gryllus bimaculatus]